MISLELGGSPTSAKNLWPEPHHIRVGSLDLGSSTKDGFENHLRSLVCAGRLSLASAQHEIALNWVAYWRSWKGVSGGSVAASSGSFYKPPGWDGHSDVDCSDFQTHAQAQSFFVGTGGSRTNDPYRLDADHDGLACASLPSLLCNEPSLFSAWSGGDPTGERDRSGAPEGGAWSRRSTQTTSWEASMARIDGRLQTDRCNGFIARHDIAWERFMGFQALVFVALGFLLDGIRLVKMSETGTGFGNSIWTPCGSG